MRRKFLACLFAVSLGILPAQANDLVLKLIPRAALVGSGELSYVFWDVYDARLYAPDGQWKPNKPFALSIYYYREIEGPDIADRSVQEIRNQGFQDEVQLAAWNSQLKTFFPDVHFGSQLTATYHPGEPTRFYHGEIFIGEVKGESFAKAFFDIWLGDKTSEPELRRKLLGIS